MYLVGAAHPHKVEAQLLLERLVAAGQGLVTDAEVLQEILHRYAAISRREAIGPALRVTLEIVDEVFAVEKADALRASEILQHPAALSARVSLHIAVMERHGVKSILSFDKDYDRWLGLKRIYREARLLEACYRTFANNSSSVRVIFTDASRSSTFVPSHVS